MLREEIGGFSKRIGSYEDLIHPFEQVKQAIKIFLCESSQPAMFSDEVSPDATHGE